MSPQSKMPPELRTSFVVQWTDHFSTLWLGVPCMLAFGMVAMCVSQGASWVNILLTVLGFLGVVFSFGAWWFFRKPIIVDRSGVWHSRLGWPTRVLVPWREILSARPVQWEENGVKGHGVLVDIDESSAWPSNMGSTPMEISQQLLRFIEGPIPVNPALLTDPWCDFDSYDLSAYICEVAASQEKQRTLDEIVKPNT